MNQNVRDEILLYWSGEADAAQSARVRVLLESDPEAQLYFDELEVLRDRVASLQSVAPSCSFAERAVSEVLAEQSAWRGVRPWLSLAAVVIITLVAAKMVWPPVKEREVEERVAQVETRKDEVVTTIDSKRQRLSERLFSRDRSKVRIQKISLARERARRLKTQLDKFPKL